MNKVLTPEEIGSFFENPLVMFKVEIFGIVLPNSTGGLTMVNASNTVDVIHAELGSTPVQTITTGTSITVTGELSAPPLVLTAILGETLQSTNKGGMFLSARNYTSKRRVPIRITPIDNDGNRTGESIVFYSAELKFTGSEFGFGPNPRAVPVEIKIVQIMTNGYDGFNSSAPESVANIAFGYFEGFHDTNPKGLPVAMFADVPDISFNDDGVRLEYNVDLKKNYGELDYVIYTRHGAEVKKHPATGVLQADKKTVIITPTDNTELSSQDIVSLFGAAGLFNEPRGILSNPIPAVRAKYVETTPPAT